MSDTTAVPAVEETYDQVIETARQEAKKALDRFIILSGGHDLPREGMDGYLIGYRDGWTDQSFRHNQEKENPCATMP